MTGQNQNQSRSRSVGRDAAHAARRAARSLDRRAAGPPAAPLPGRRRGAGSPPRPARSRCGGGTSRTCSKRPKTRSCATGPRRFPRVTLQPVKVPYAQMATKMVTSLAAGRRPRRQLHPPGLGRPLRPEAGLPPLDDLAKQGQRPASSRTTTPRPSDYHRWKGKLYGLAWLMEGSTLFYNKNLLEKAGLADPRELDRRGQWTLERFRDYLPRLSGGRADQRTWGWNQGVTGKLSNWVDSIWQFGGEAFSADGLKLTLHQPASVEALEWRVSHYKSRITLAGDPEGGGVDDELRAPGLPARQPPAHLRPRPQRALGAGAPPAREVGQRWHRAGCSAHGIIARSKQEGPSWELVKYLSPRGQPLRHAEEQRQPPVAGRRRQQGVRRVDAPLGRRGELRRSWVSRSR